MIGDPASAPPRPDLGFLRRRSAPPPAPPISFARPSHAAPTAAPSLDLSEPVSFARPLDLTSTPDVPAAPARPAPRVHQDARIAGTQQLLLGVTRPTVTLTRVQSAVGQVQVEAVCGPDVGDLRLGGVYQLRDGASSTVQLAGGNRFAPSSRRPVIVAGRDEYEHLRVDLRQVGELERLAVYAFSESRTELRWGGTLVLTTFGGGRVELPLESLQPGRVAVLMSIYNMDGELVVRGELETVAGDVREAARAYGYDRITWRDDRVPVD